MIKAKVIFDTDPGIDDAMALLYLNACNNLELIAITTILGNADIDQCTRNALILRDMFGIKVPVYKGASSVTNGTTPDEYPDFVHGKDGLGDVGLPEVKSATKTENAASALVRLSEDFAGDLILLAVGRLTNVALAIQKDPNFVQRLRQVIIMGGAYKHPGNVTPWAEANIIGDPEAADIVFNSGLPLTMVGLDVTTQTRMSMEYLRPIAAKLGELGDFILKINNTYASNYMRMENSSDFPVHDSSAVACTTKPDLFEMLQGNLRCILEGEQRGRTVFTRDPLGPHKVCIEANSHEILIDYSRRVTNFYSR